MSNNYLMENLFDRDSFFLEKGAWTFSAECLQVGGVGGGGGMRVNNAYCGHIILTIHIHYMAKCGRAMVL